MIDLVRLAEPMTGGGCRAELLTEGHRDQMRTACAEDPKIWSIYYISYAPDDFDASFDALLKRPWIAFALYNGDDFAGFSCYLEHRREPPGA